MIFEIFLYKIEHLVTQLQLKNISFRIRKNKAPI
jgi:hypothetical protein